MPFFFYQLPRLPLWLGSSGPLVLMLERVLVLSLLFVIAPCILIDFSGFRHWKRTSQQPQPAKENPNQHKLPPTIFPISENGNLSYNFVFSFNCLFRHSHCPHPDQSLHHLLSKLLQQPVNLPTSTPAHCFIINIVVKVILLKYTPAQPA